MHGSAGVTLLKELKRNKNLPAYNDDGMRQVVREIDGLYKIIYTTLNENDYQVSDPTIACGLVVHHQGLLRNKRCALAYISNRAERITRMWWKTGTVLPDGVKANLSPNENVFFEGYDSLMNDYMSKVGVQLTADQTPPKDLYVEVRVLKDYGEISTDIGMVTLEKHTTTYLPRRDCELLIRQGVLELTSDSGSGLCINRL